MTQGRSWDLWLGATASALAVAAVGTVADAVYSPVWGPLEAEAFREVLATRQPALTALMRVLTDLGDIPVLVAVSLAVLVTGWPAGRPADRWGPLAALVVGGLANLALKGWFHRPRPGLDYHPLVEEPFSSFPSGHAMLSLCVYGFLAWLVARSPLPRVGRAALQALLWAVVLMVGLSRVYLAAHYPGDVAGGYAAGIPVLWALILVQRAAEKAGGPGAAPG